MGENSSGFTNEQSPQGGAFSRDLLDQKSKSPLFPGPGVSWLQMTGALKFEAKVLMIGCAVTVFVLHRQKSCDAAHI